MSHIHHSTVSAKSAETTAKTLCLVTAEKASQKASVI